MKDIIYLPLYKSRTIMSSPSCTLYSIISHLRPSGCIHPRVLVSLLFCSLAIAACAGETNTPASASPPTNLVITGALPNGPSFDIVYSGGYVYVAEGSEVRVYFSGTDSQIRGLGWRSAISKVAIDDAIYALTLDGNNLYVVSGGKLSILDITTRSSPRIIAELKNPYPYTMMRDAAVSGTTAYVSVHGAGILVVNMTDPRHPSIAQKVAFEGYNRPWRLAVSDHFLYVPLETDGRLEILDISRPLTPVGAGRFSAGEMTSFSGVAVKDGYAYISEYHTGVRIIDVRNASTPREVSRVTGVNANDIRIQGNRAYVSVRYQGFSVYDIPKPGTLILAGQASGMEGYIEGICPSGNRTYLAGESFGFAVYDTSNPAAPSLMVKVPVIGGVDSLAVYGNYLVVGAHNLGVWLVDVTDPTDPHEVTFIDVGGRNSMVDVKGSTLYTAGQWCGLSIVDISDPLHPVVRTRDFGENIGSVLVDGEYAFTDAGIVDVRNTSAPSYVRKDPIFNGRFVKYRTDYLLVADSLSSTTKGLRILDVRDRSNPREIATFSPGTACIDVVICGSTAVALTGNDIIAVDLSDMNRPQEISRLSYAGIWSGTDLFINGSIVYAVGGPTGDLRSIDVSNPANMTLTTVTDLPTSDPYNAVVVAGSAIYVGNKWGLCILSASTPTPTVTPAPFTPPTVIAGTPETTPPTAALPGLYTVTTTQRVPLVFTAPIAVLLALFIMGMRKKHK